MAKEQLDRQANLILSLETSLDQRAVIPLDAPEYEKDAKIIELYVHPAILILCCSDIVPSIYYHQPEAGKGVRVRYTTL